MAKYIDAINDTLRAEGIFNGSLGYVKDPQDAGGETVAGISRRFHPTWDGWKIVDGYKNKPNFPYTLKKDEILIQKVMAFYKPNFWDKIDGDHIKDQEIASMLLKEAVLGGYRKAIKRAESIVGLTETGVITTDLIRKLNAL